MARARHLPCGSTSLVAAYAAALSLSTTAFAKTPGEVHCYNGICHRVKTVEEMLVLVGTETEALTSYYDVPERDRMNAGTITSSGEEFDADSDSHAASSLYPDGTELLVWNPKNQKAAHIRVNDFGPFYMLRTIDVTRGVAEKLEFVKTGVARLRIMVIWAPSRDEARFRRRRVYPALEGYIGRFDADQLDALKSRLIATAPDRNGRPVYVAAANPRALPASGAGDDPIARRRSAIANMPLVALGAHGPAFVAAAHAPLRTVVATLRPARAQSDSSSRAIAAASLPAQAIVTARDADVATAVASLTQPVDAPVRAESEVAVARPVFSEAAARGPWAPSALLWQQVLIALSLTSAGALAWRTRALTPQRRTASNTRLRGPAPGHAAAVAAAPAYIAPERHAALDILPLLPHPPQTRTMDELRDAAIADMERYAYADAEHAYRQLLAAREAALGAADPLTASAARQLADCLREQGRYGAAEPLYRRALTTMAAACGELHPATADILDDYAISLLRQGHGRRAETVSRQALSIRAVSAPRSRAYAATLSIVAEALRAQGQLTHAELEHRTAWSLFVAVSGQDSLDAAASMLSLGAVMGELGRLAGAEELLNAGIRIVESACGAHHPATASAYSLLGELYRRASALDSAHTMHAHALAIREKVLGPRHPDTAESLLALAMIATDKYQTNEARKLLDRALDGLVTAERTTLGPQSRIRGFIVALSHHHDTNEPVRIAAE